MLIVEIEIVASWIGATMIVAAPTTVGSAVEAAVIATVPGPTAVTSPLALTVAMLAAVEAHVTVRARVASALTLATNCTLWPTLTEALGGVTVTLCTAGAAAELELPGATVTLSPQAVRPAITRSPVNIERDTFCILPPNQRSDAVNMDLQIAASQQTPCATSNTQPSRD